jgi:hypothetical protein
MKNFFFGISVLALLLVGCDDGNIEPSVSDAGRLDTLPGQPSGSLRDMMESGKVSCPIPVSTLASPKIGVVPSVGYRYAGPVPSYFTFSHCSESGGYVNESTDCNSPANGFALTSSDPWCCVNAVSSDMVWTYDKLGHPITVPSISGLLTPTLLCSSKTDTFNMAQDTAGKVALCLDDGKAGLFMGWDCNVKI